MGLKKEQQMPKNSKTSSHCRASLKKVVRLSLILCSFVLVSLNGLSARAADGTPLWTNVFKGTGNSDDYAQALAVDASGNAYVSGTLYRSGSGYAYATIKYSSAGVALWTNLFGTTSLTAIALAVDGSGNAYISVYASGLGSGLDYTTIKYSNAGAAMWTNVFNGAGNGNDFANALAVDTVGNVYVTGTSSDGSLYPGYTTIKYSTTGVPLWTNLFHTLDATSHEAKALATDKNGNVYVTGSAYGKEWALDHWNYRWEYATVKYSTDGVALWTNLFSLFYGTTNGGAKARALTVDASDNVYVTGDRYGLRSDYATIKYSSAGAALWTNLFNGAYSSDDHAEALVVDANGNVYVTGYATGIGDRRGYATIKYSSTGAGLWTNLFNGPGIEHDYASDVAVDANGNVYVTGSVYGRADVWFYDYATIKYSTTGVALWTNLFNGVGNGGDSDNRSTVDGNGNVYVTGSATGSGSGYDFATIKYSGATIDRPLLKIQRSSGGVVLSWTNAAFSLQTESQLNGAFTNIPGATSPYTNPVTGSRQFFRLIGN